MNNTATTLLPTKDVVTTLKSKNNTNDRKTMLQENGFKQIAPKGHQDGDEVIIIHYGTGGAGANHVVVSTTSRDAVDYYRKSSDTKGAEFYKRD